MIRNSILKFFLFFPCVIESSPWISAEDIGINTKIESLAVNCQLIVPNLSNYPVSKGSIYAFLKNNKENQTEQCLFEIEDLEKIIEKSSLNKKEVIGFQSSSPDLYFHDFSKRYLSDNNFYYELSDTHGNWSYKLKIQSLYSSGNENYDESYISYKHNNTIFTFGRYTRWWSSSKDTSLILSNNAAPTLGFSVKNYIPIEPKISILKKFFGKYNYEVFLNEFEDNRDYPNALFLGNRFNINPNDGLEISLYRIFQFGGEGRDITRNMIRNIITGKDTSNSKQTNEETAGNQIAGIDFRYRTKAINGLKFYGQLFGEDGLDPIIDDRWVGAIFPSKRFGLIGASYSFGNFDNLTTISIERSTTDTGFINTTYNHSIYKTGYRFKGKSIGAAIDADSDRNIFSIFRQVKNDTFLELKFSESDVNKNNSLTNSLSDSNFEKNNIKLSYTTYFNKNLRTSIIMTRSKIRGDLYIPQNDLFFDIQLIF